MLYSANIAMKSAFQSKVRVPCELKAKIGHMARNNGMSICRFLRLCICRQLCELEAGRINLKSCLKTAGRRPGDQKEEGSIHR